jgi:hypothetical protein
MLFHNISDHTQAQAGARLALGGKKGLKYLLVLIGSDAPPTVLNGYFDLIALRLKPAMNVHFP